ncbi:MAG: hypothetical protein ACOCQS_00225 [Bacillota bacterium]
MIQTLYEKETILNNYTEKFNIKIVILVYLIFIFIFSFNVQSEEINLKGDNLSYDNETGIAEINGNINGKYNKFHFFSEEIIINSGDGEKRKIFNDPEKINLDSGSFTGCDLDEPHYFFKSSKTVIHPGEYLEAYNVVFREAGGKLPLFYWPYLYISLKREDQKLIPEYGYDSRRGWFIKTTYNYDIKNQLPLEVYLDYYTGTGEAGGFKQYYIYEPEEKGFFSLYGQKNKSNISGLSQWYSEFSYENRDILLNPEFFLNYQHFDNYSQYQGEIDLQENIENADLEMETDYEKKDYYERERKTTDNRETLDYNINYYQDFSGLLNYDIDYDINWEKEGENSDIIGEDEGQFNFNYYQIDDLNLRLGYEREKDVNRDMDEFIEDEKDLEFDYRFGNNWDYNIDMEQGTLKEESGSQNNTTFEERWEGSTSLEKSFSDYKMSVLLERDEPYFDEEGVRYFALPEVLLTYSPSFNWEYDFTAGNFYESDTGTHALRGGAGITYDNRWEILPGNYFSTEQNISSYIYRNMGSKENLLSEENITGVLLHQSDLSLESNITENLTLDNSFFTSDETGETPFQFDKQEKERLLESELDYEQKYMGFNLEGGYDFLYEEYLLVEGLLAFYPLPDWTIEMGTSYDINRNYYEDDFILKNQYEQENISFNTIVRYNLNDSKLKRLENELTYEVPGDWGWYLENNVSFDYEDEEPLDEASLSLTKKMHCRELWFTYDHIDESFTFTYKLDLFPDHSVTMGRDEDDSYIFETGLEEMLAEDD